MPKRISAEQTVTFILAYACKCTGIGVCLHILSFNPDLYQLAYFFKPCPLILVKLIMQLIIYSLLVLII